MKKPRAPEPPAEARKPRGRPRSFEREAALDAAMELFREKGYESASITDLTGAMGINAPSLYSAFGDKEKLFLAAAERYLQVRRAACPYYEEPTARQAIERLLTYMAHELTQGHNPKGCLLQMATATAANASPALQKALAEHRAWGRERMRARIRKGIADGDVPAGTDANALGDLYYTVLSGMSMQARDGASARSLLAIVRQALKLFPEAPQAARQRKRRATEAA